MPGEGARVGGVLPRSVPAQRATLLDVAAKVGVSARTVSRVVNDEDGFSEETRNRVLAAVAELNYQPNLLARGLIRQRSDTFGFVITMIDDPFFPDLALGVQAAARELGRTMLFGVSNHDAKVEDEVLRSMTSHAVAGAIIFPAGEDQAQVRAYADAGLPMVLLDDSLDHANVCSVSVDLYDGARQAAAHLIEAGRTRLSILSGRSPERKRRRIRGFTDTAAEAGLGVDAMGVDLTIEAGRQATMALLDRNPLVDAIFAHNDLIAIGCLKALKATGRTVPDDVAVIGCDGIEMSEHVSPALTTIDIDRQQLGRTAVERLDQLIAGSNPGPITLPVQLRVRASTAEQAA